MQQPTQRTSTLPEPAKKLTHEPIQVPQFRICGVCHLLVSVWLSFLLLLSLLRTLVLNRKNTWLQPTSRATTDSGGGAKKGWWRRKQRVRRSAHVLRELLFTGFASKIPCNNQKLGSTACVFPPKPLLPRLRDGSIALRLFRVLELCLRLSIFIA
jgi:hypothetical protein